MCRGEVVVRSRPFIGENCHVEWLLQNARHGKGRARGRYRAQSQRSRARELQGPSTDQRSLQRRIEGGRRCGLGERFDGLVSGRIDENCVVADISVGARCQMLPILSDWDLLLF